MVPPTSCRNAELTFLLVGYIPAILAALARSFPRAPVDAREDAVSEALLAYVAKPDPWANVWRSGGRLSIYRYFRTVAWRGLRAEHRRGLRRTTLPGGAGSVARPAPCDGPGGRQPFTGPEQEVALLAREGLAMAIEAGVSESGAADRTRVREALLDALTSDDSDTLLAQRHSVRREYVNRARRRVHRELNAVLSSQRAR